MLRLAIRRAACDPLAVSPLKRCLAFSYSSLASHLKLSTIQAPHTGEISLISLNRPKARNAISKQLLGELSDVVEQLHSEGPQSSTRALILASDSDEAFCAGADLKERLTFTHAEYASSACNLLLAATEKLKCHL